MGPAWMFKADDSRRQAPTELQHSCNKRHGRGAPWIRTAARGALIILQSQTVPTAVTRLRYEFAMLSHAIRQHDGRAILDENGLMRVLVATDAWHPQVNGVVRTLTSLACSARSLGVTIDFLTPEGFPTIPVPTYPGLRLALPLRRGIVRRIEAARPDAIHIATEGPIGHAVHAYCRRHGRPFTTSYTTRFPEYISARARIPECWIYAALRRFHAAATVTMVATPSLYSELSRRGFSHLGMWTRGVDTDLFRPDRAIALNFPRPIFIVVGRVAVEKNLNAFLSLDLPGTKIVIGEGPQEEDLKRRFPDVKFLGQLENGTWQATWLPPMYSYFPAGRTHSAWCNLKRWRAAFRLRPSRSPARRTWSPIIPSES
jgi:glycosyltransferase involved in cell wall biosynthesis